MSTTQTSPASTLTGGSSSRFSFRHKSAASPAAAATDPPTGPSAPMSARESLLRVARSGRSSATDVPTISIHRAADDDAAAASYLTSAAGGGGGGRELPLRSPGDEGFDPLLDPVGYSVKTDGVPAFRHAEFGWCANPAWRHTSQVRVVRVLSSGLQG